MNCSDPNVWCSGVQYNPMTEYSIIITFIPKVVGVCIVLGIIIYLKQRWRMSKNEEIYE